MVRKFGSRRPRPAATPPVAGSNSPDPVELGPPVNGIHQDAFARFRETISWARSTKARKLAAVWRRLG